MKLKMDIVEDTAVGTPEYKSAVKSVILCEIQSLLQKLATDVGEESIVIFTDASSGGYHHLGSYMGREYLLEDSDSCVENLCLNFSYYCTGQYASSHTVGVPLPAAAENNIDDDEKTSRHQHTRVKSTPRKRLQNHSPQDCPTPPLKRKPLNGEDFGLVSGQVENSINNIGNEQTASLSKEGNSSACFKLLQGDQSSQKEGGYKSHTVPWIKVEPSDDYSLTDQQYSNQNGIMGDNCEDDDDGKLMIDTSTTSEDVDTGNSVKNRPTSLIPLANIFRKIASKKEQKTSPAKKPEQGPATSILRFLCESQPIYKVGDLGSGPKSMNASATSDKVAMNLPSDLGDSIANDQYSSSNTTENLVLSGYYDSDTYPTYRHRQKHILSKLSKKISDNKAAQEALVKKEDTAEKDRSPVHVSTTPTAADTPQIFESGGRLIYTCDVCNRELSHLTSYRRHLKLHTSDRPHTCPVCKKGFIRKYHCIDHLKKHHHGIEFEADTLTLKNPADAIVGAQPEAYTYSPSQTDYNYTLDQSSAGMSDGDTVTKESIDHSASTMLSVLAQSVAGDSCERRLNFNQSCESHSPNDEGVNAAVTEFAPSQLDDDNSNSSGADSYQNNANPLLEAVNQNDTNPLLEPGNLIDVNPLLEPANQNNIAPSIKDIVAHLKSSKDQKKQKRKSAEAELSSHLLKYMDNTSFTCLLCSKVFSTKSSLSRHMFMHESADITSCSLCERSFLNKEDYRYHLLKVHEIVKLEEVSV